MVWTMQFAVFLNRIFFELLLLIIAVSVVSKCQLYLNHINAIVRFSIGNRQMKRNAYRMLRPVYKSRIVSSNWIYFLQHVAQHAMAKKVSSEINTLHFKFLIKTNFSITLFFECRFWIEERISQLFYWLQSCAVWSFECCFGW